MPSRQFKYLKIRPGRCVSAHIPCKWAKNSPPSGGLGSLSNPFSFLIVSKGRIHLDAPPCRERKSAPSAQANASQKRCSTAASWARAAVAADDAVGSRPRDRVLTVASGRHVRKRACAGDIGLAFHAEERPHDHAAQMRGICSCENRGIPADAPAFPCVWIQFSQRICCVSTSGYAVSRALSRSAARSFTPVIWRLS